MGIFPEFLCHGDMSTGNMDVDMNNMNILDDDEASRLAAQALHAFFLDDVVTNEDIVDLSEETATACWYQESLDTLVENDHKNEGLLCYCNLDDGTVVPVNREAVGQKSEVFAAMLGQNFLEGQVPSIPIKETDSRAFQV